MSGPVSDVAEIVAEVADPELPHVTIGDLGMIREVHVDGRSVRVTLAPTYTGCPATEQIGDDVTAALAAAGYSAEVRFVLSPPWSTDDITTRGRARLTAAGIAPPGDVALVTCPRCGSRRVRLVAEFGSTPCKSAYTCRACLEPFDRFKEY